MGSSGSRVLAVQTRLVFGWLLVRGVEFLRILPAVLCISVETWVYVLASMEGARHLFRIILPGCVGCGLDS